MKTRPKGLKPVSVESITIPLYRFGDGRVGPVWREGGRRFKRPYKDPGKAKREAEKIAIRLSNGQRETLDFTAADREIYLHAKRIAEPHGVSIIGALEQWAATRKPATAPPTADLVEQLLKSKTDHKLSPRYMRGLKGDLESFAKAFPLPIDQIKSLSIENYLRDLKVGDRRRNNVRDEIVTLFLYAKNHEHLPEDKTTEAEKVRRIELDHGQPEIYTPPQLRIILEHVLPEWLPWVCIGAFAGIRPEEIAKKHTSKKGGVHQLLWTDFNWHERQIHVSRFISKVKRDRYVPINDTLFAWLEPWQNATGPVCVDNRPDRETGRLGKLLGFDWIPDGLRHSFGSYWQSQNRNIEKLAEIMGNSIPVIRRHYYNPRPESAAKKWFAVMPDRDSKIVQLPLAMTFQK